MRRFLVLTALLTAACSSNPSSSQFSTTRPTLAIYEGPGSDTPCGELGQGELPLEVRQRARGSEQREVVTVGRLIKARADLTMRRGEEAVVWLASDRDVRMPITWSVGEREVESKVVTATGDAWSEVHFVAPEDGCVRLVVENGRRPLDLAVARRGSGRRRRDRRPDLLLVLVDTLRSDHLGLYGYARDTSPRLDEWSRRAWVFEESRSASTWTLPSTASLMTGLFPQDHGLRRVEDRLAPGAVTVAELLSAAGYQTAAFVDGGFLSRRWGLSQGFQYYWEAKGAAWDPKDVREVLGQARRWLDEERDSDVPLFLMVHTYETHMPYRNSEGFADAFLAQPRDTIGLPEDLTKVLRSRPPDSIPEIVQPAIDLYDGEIRRVDHFLGEFLEELEVEQDFVVLITSDHGEEFLEFGNFEHGLGKLYDPNLRVPMILKIPGDRGGRSQRAVSGVDVLPTLLDLAGVSDVSGLPGQSLLSLRGEDRQPDRLIFAEGLNSYPELDENHLLLRRGEAELRVDVVRNVASGSTDPAVEGSLVPLANHLLASREEGFTVALEAGVDGVESLEGSRLELVAAFQAGRRIEAVSTGAGKTVTLDSQLSTTVLLGFRSGADGLGLNLQEAGVYRAFRPRRAERAWQLDLSSAEPPRLGELEASALRDQSVRRALTSDEVVALRALGYVQ